MRRPFHKIKMASFRVLVGCKRVIDYAVKVGIFLLKS